MAKTDFKAYLKFLPIVFFVAITFWLRLVNLGEEMGDGARPVDTRRRVKDQVFRRDPDRSLLDSFMENLRKRVDQFLPDGWLSVREAMTCCGLVEIVAGMDSVRIIALIGLTDA